MEIIWNGKNLIDEILPILNTEIEKGTYRKNNFSDEKIIKKRVAREILSMIETVCFSEEFRDFRVNEGSNGTINLIIENIKNTYDIG